MKKLDYYKEEKESGGMHEYSDRKLFAGIRKFQSDSDLKIDGIIKPRGKTEKKLARKLFSGIKKFQGDNDLKVDGKMK